MKLLKEGETADYADFTEFFKQVTKSSNGLGNASRTQLADTKKKSA
jgi:hypothetical protein